jgi:hypothetical protein
MAEYKECEALIEHMKDLPTWDFVAKADGVYEKATKYPEGMFNCDDVIASIENAPAADVVEVTRCQYCKHATEDIIVEGVCYCHKIQQGMYLDGFCSYGERKCDD